MFHAAAGPDFGPGLAVYKERKKIMKMYLDSGYINMRGLIESDWPFLFITGARGTGKTYGGLKSIRELQEEKKINRFLYLRRTQVETDIISSEDMNPFKKINTDTGTDITMKSIRQGIYGFYMEETLIGYAAALSTFRNLRGFDFSDVDIIFYDEFIPEPGARPIKNEAVVLFNIFESVNRNRELEGAAAVKMICCSNSNELGNPIFMELGILSKLEKLTLSGGGTYRDPDRGLMVVLLKDSPISKRKKDTALYRLTGSGSFADMALMNVFQDNDRDSIKPQSLQEYGSSPIVTLDGVAIYRHKSKNLYYGCTFTGEPEFTTSARDLERFNLRYYYLWNRYIDGELLFENYLTKQLFITYNKGR